MKSDHQKALELELQALAQTRDELKLQLHLASADARDAYHRLESKWTRLNEELQRSLAHTKSAGQAALGDAKTLLDELKRAYEEVKRTVVS
jgi:predicted  nucleic acid-binding Zn-ribbon protein